MKREFVRDLLDTTDVDREVTVAGWVRTRRDSKGGFSFIVEDPQFCCYIVQFTGPTGAVILEQEECFNCTVVGAEETSWGTIKALFD